jgi:uncharacterized protein
LKKQKCPCMGLWTESGGIEIRYLLLTVIRIYQLVLSPLLGANCRFYPTCSEYAHEAISRHGIIKGCYLSGKRLLKCHPFHPGGVDLVP